MSTQGHSTSPMEDARIQNVDPETAFLASKRQTGNEWELFKENVRPLKRGRNVNLLNDSLKSHTGNHLKKSLLDKRRKLIEAIDDYKGDDPLQSWLECIKWVQEAFPPGGDCSGLLVIYEQCVRAFWHSDRYKDDLRYLKVWLEYADNCRDAEVIYNFLDANEIGKPHSLFYISYALHMEAKNKMKMANEIFNLGISRNAQPIKKLEDAYRKFLARSMRRPLAIDEEKSENGPPARSFGTVLAKGEKTRQATLSSDLASRKQKPERVPLAICKDTNVGKSSSHQPDISKKGPNFWNNLGGRAERNKENNAQPAKWTSYKIPQKLGQRTGVAAASTCIEVFVDEECAEMGKGGGKSSTLELRQGDGKDLKEATELLRENPLRNFPPNSLPR